MKALGRIVITGSRAKLNCRSPSLKIGPVNPDIGHGASNVLGLIIRQLDYSFVRLVRAAEPRWEDHEFETLHGAPDWSLCESAPRSTRGAGHHGYFFALRFSAVTSEHMAFAALHAACENFIASSGLSDFPAFSISALT
jgi:hypothetical protein